MEVGPRDGDVGGAAQIDEAITALEEFEVMEPEAPGGELAGRGAGAAAHGDDVARLTAHAQMTIVGEAHVGDDDVLHVAEAQRAVQRDVATATVDGLVAPRLDILGIEHDLTVDVEHDPPALVALQRPSQRPAVAAAGAAARGGVDDVDP